ncbi:MAG TPA: PAS domain S-box protein [Acidobacteriaceae bacterium]
MESQKVLDSLPQLVCATDSEGAITFLNRSWFQYTGRHATADLEALWFDTVHPEDREQVASSWTIGVPTLQPFEHRYRIRAKNGQYRWFDSHAAPIFSRSNHLVGWICSSTDVQGQMDAELAARMERDRLNTVVENVPVGIVLAEAPSGRIVFGNPAVETVLRHPVLATGAIEDHTQWPAFHPNGSPIDPKDFPLVRAMATGKTINGEEFLYRRGDGTFGWVRITASPITDSAGNIVAGIAAIADIDQEKLMIERTLAAESRFHQLIEISFVGLQIVDSHGIVSYMNPVLRRMLGYTLAEITGGHLHRSRLTPAEFSALDARVEDQLQRNGTCEPYETIYLAKDGARIPVLTASTMMRSETGTDTEVASFVFDLTTAKRSESALLQSEKLAVAGRLAASISHEINNPLEAVTNLLYIIGMEPLSPQIAQYLQQAQAELGRVSHIAAQTLRFYRQTTKPAPMKSSDLTDSVISLYRSRLQAANIHLVLDHREHKPIVGYASELRQVLANLIGNALDAMNGMDPRVLTIRSRPATDWRTGHAGVRITVADTGSGMDNATLEHIFEPFFTTKSETGTGLGLWVSEEILHKRSGSLRVRSSRLPEHRGSVFAFFLPYAA